jgi:hypothetical protein
VAIIFLSFPASNGAMRLAASVLSVFSVIVLVFRDRTARRKSDQETLRLGALLNSSEDAIIGQTLDGTILTSMGVRSGCSVIPPMRYSANRSRSPIRPSVSMNLRLSSSA